MLLSDRLIKEFVLNYEMITPFVDKQVKVDEDGRNILSYGLSSFGYDVRLGPELKIFESISSSGYSLLNVPLDPLCHKDENYRVVKPNPDGSFVIPPGGFLLGHTVEYFKIPRQCLVVCLGKSTYARLGLVVNVTPLEPEWEGQVVIEMSNTSQRPIKVYTGMGIAQFIFHHSNAVVEVSYKDRNGKYQNQTGVTTAKV